MQEVEVLHEFSGFTSGNVPMPSGSPYQEFVYRCACGFRTPATSKSRAEDLLDRHLAKVAKA